MNNLRIGIPRKRKARKDTFFSHNPLATSIDVEAYENIKDASPYFTKDNSLLELCKVKDRNTKTNSQLYFLPRIYETKITWKTEKMKEKMKVPFKQLSRDRTHEESGEKWMSFQELKSNYHISRYYRTILSQDSVKRERVKKILTLHYQTKLENGSYLAFIRVKRGDDYIRSTKHFDDMMCVLDYKDHEMFWSVNFSEMVLTGSSHSTPAGGGSQRPRNSHRAFVIPFSIDYYSHTGALHRRPRRLHKAKKYEVNFSFKRQFRHVQEKWKFEISIGQVFIQDSEMTDNITLPAGQPYLFSLQQMYQDQKITLRYLGGKNRQLKDKITFKLSNKSLPVQIIDFPSHERRMKNRMYAVVYSTRYKRIRYFDQLVPRPKLYPYNLHGFVGRNRLDYKKFFSELRDLREFHTAYPCYMARLFIKLKMRQKDDWDLLNTYIRQLMFLVSYYIKVCEQSYLTGGRDSQGSSFSFLNRDGQGQGRDGQAVMMDTEDMQKMFPKEFGEWHAEHFTSKLSESTNKKKRIASHPGNMFSQGRESQADIFSSGKKNQGASRRSHGERGLEPNSHLEIYEVMEIIDYKPELIHKEFVRSKKIEIFQHQRKILKEMGGPGLSHDSSTQSSQSSLYNVFKLSSHRKQKDRESSFTGFKIPENLEQQIYFLLYNLLFRSDNLIRVLDHFRSNNDKYVNWARMELSSSGDESVSMLSKREFFDKYSGGLMTSFQHQLILEQQQQQNEVDNIMNSNEEDFNKNKKKKTKKKKKKKLERQYNDGYFEEVFNFKHYDKLVDPYLDDKEDRSKMSHRISMILVAHEKIIEFLCKKIIPTLKQLHTHLQPIVDSLNRKDNNNNNNNKPYNEYDEKYNTSSSSPSSVSSTTGRTRATSYFRALPTEFLVKKKSLQMSPQKKKEIDKNNNNNTSKSSPKKKKKNKKKKSKKKKLYSSFSKTTSTTTTGGSTTTTGTGSNDELIDKYKDRHFEELKVRFGVKYQKKYMLAREHIQKIFQKLTDPRVVEECKEAYSLPGVREDILEEFHNIEFWKELNKLDYQNNSIFLLYEDIIKHIPAQISSSSSSSQKKTNNTSRRKRSSSPSSIRRRQNSAETKNFLDSRKKYDENAIFGDYARELSEINEKIDEKNRKYDDEQHKNYSPLSEQPRKRHVKVPSTYILRILCRFCRKLSMKYGTYVRKLGSLVNNQLILTQRDLEEEEGEDEDEDSENEHKQQQQQQHKKNKKQQQEEEDSENEDNHNKRKTTTTTTTSLTNKRLKKLLRYQMDSVVKTVRSEFHPRPIPYIHMLPCNHFDVLETKIEILLQEKLKNAMKKTVDVYSSFIGQYVDTARIQIRLNLWDILNRKCWKDTLGVYEKEGTIDTSKVLKQLKFLRQLEEIRIKDIKAREIRMRQMDQRRNRAETGEHNNNKDLSHRNNNFDDEDDDDDDDSDSSSSSSSSSSDVGDESDDEELEEELKPFQDYRKFATLMKVNAQFNSGRDLKLFSPREGLSSEIEIHVETALKSLRSYHQAIIKYNPFLGPNSKLFSSASHKKFFSLTGLPGSRQGLVSFLPQGSLGGKTKKEKIIQKLLAERNVIFSEFNNSPLFSRVVRKQLLPSLEAVFHHGFIAEYKSAWVFTRVTSIWELSKYYFEKNLKYQNVFECIMMVFPKSKDSNSQKQKKKNKKRGFKESQKQQQIHSRKKHGEEMLNVMKFRSLICKLLTDKKIGMFFQDYSKHPKIQAYYSPNSIIRQESVRREMGKRMLLIDENYELNIHYELNLVEQS